MFEKIETWLTLGNQYVAATMLYLGLAVLLGGSTLLDHPQALASCTGCYTVGPEGQLVPGCPDGQFCCNGTCISSVNICCEDGTYGPANSCECLCCEDCGPYNLVTIVCD